MRDSGLSLLLEAVYCPPGSPERIDEGSVTLAELATGNYFPPNMPTGQFLQFKPPLDTNEQSYAANHSSYPSSTPVEIYVNITFASGAMLRDQCQNG